MDATLGSTIVNCVHLIIDCLLNLGTYIYIKIKCNNNM